MLDKTRGDREVKIGAKNGEEKQTLYRTGGDGEWNIGDNLMKQLRNYTK